MIFNKIYHDYNSIILHIHIPKSGGTTVKENLSTFFKTNQIAKLREPYINHYHTNSINSSIEQINKNKIKEWLKKNFLLARKISQMRQLKYDLNDFTEKTNFRDFELLTTKEKKDLRIIYSIQERMTVPNISGKHFLKTLVIRDPVSRIQSYYFQAKKKNKKNTKPYMIAAQKYDINDFIEYLYDERPYMVNNPNCVCLSGTEDFSITKKIIDNEFFLAAPLEKINEFMKLICLKLFSKSINFKSYNVSNNNPKEICISDKLINKLLISNKSDVDLKKHIEIEFNNILSKNNFSQSG